MGVALLDIRFVRLDAGLV